MPLLSTIFRALAPRRLQRLRDQQRSRTHLRALPTELVDASSLRRVTDASTLFRITPPESIPNDVPDEGTFGMNIGDRRALYAIVAGLDAHAVLDIGTNVGASTGWLAAALSRVTHPRLVTVDIMDANTAPDAPWRTSGLERSPMERLGADAAFTTFISQPSLSFLRATDETFDVIVLDGDHRATTLYQEIPLAIQHLNPGGVVLLHDYFEGLRPIWNTDELLDGPYLAIERFRREGAPFDAQSLSPLPWPTKHGTRLTSLAIVTRH